jgi:hypothetical protein
MAGEGYHETVDALTAETMDRHRAIVSLQEELEAIDWYQQRIDAATDTDLAAILAHNRDEEREHAAMLLEWLRRRDLAWDAVLRTYIFTEAPVTDVEVRAEEPAAARAPNRPPGGVLAVGDLRGGETR